MKADDLKWLAIYVALKIIMVPFVIMPRKLAIRAGAMLGGLLYHILPKWRRIGLENVEKLLPYLQAQPSWNCPHCTPDEIIREVFANIGILTAELSILNFSKGKTLLASVEFRGIENYKTAHSRGRGIVCVTAHSGNWELMALTFGVSMAPVAVVARTMKKDYFSQILEKIRTQFGNSVIYRDNGVREMLACLKANGVIGILPDQVVLPPHGILVDFFGRPCWTSFMPVKLALKTGSAILPFFIHRENGKNIITVYPELELLTAGSVDERILDGTIKMNQALEKHILKHPTQWNWLYRRWKETERRPLAMQRPEKVTA